MKNIEELEKIAEIEWEKLGVAENIGWAASGFAACAAYLKWDSWWLAISVLIGLYFIITYPYRKRQALAEDAHHKASKLGNYHQSKNIDDI